MSGEPHPQRPARTDAAAGGRSTAPADRPGRAAERPRRPGGSLFMGGLVMLVLAVLLSWLPLLGPLVAGGVGGWMIAEPRRAIAVALIPAVALAVVVGLLLTAFDLPVLGALAGVGVFLFVLVQEIPLLAGAWGGAALAGRS